MKYLLIRSLLLITVTLFPALASAESSNFNKVVQPNWEVQLSSLKKGGELKLKLILQSNHGVANCQIVSTETRVHFNLEYSSSAGGVRRLHTYYSPEQDLKYSRPIERKFNKFCGATPPLDAKDYYSNASW